jgi:cobalt-zinc-cadmium resistance protein CzcA
MIQRLVAFSLQQRLLVLGATLVLAVFGFMAFKRLPVQAFPDVQNVFVQIITQLPGQAPEEVEKLATLPIEREMNGLPHLVNLRSVSIFGLSVVTLTFDDTAEDYFSRQQVAEHLQNVVLPTGVQPQIAPLTTGIGEIFRYVLNGPGLSLVEQRAAEDWIIERELRTVPGVADVVAFGGGVKQYQVEVDPARLKDYRVTLAQVSQALAANNANTGGGSLEHGDEALVVRGIGLLERPEDIAGVVVTSHGGTPVRVGDVARVSVGPQPRLGIAAVDGRDDVVEGTVLLVKGKDAATVLAGVKAKIAALNAHGLPPGLHIEPIYDRTDLVDHTIDTVVHNMVEGTLLILVMLLVFLRRVTATLVVVLVIPLSLLAAFLLIDVEGISANLVSLGAIDFGVIVDSAVVLVEAVMVRITAELQQSFGIHHLRQTLLIVATEMGRPILFAKAIIIIAFLPIFTFQRVEQKIFSPMAYTLCFALLGSLVLSLTLVPTLLSYAVGPRLSERHNALVEWLERRYRQALPAVLRVPRRAVVCAVLALAASLGTLGSIGSEFMPKLDEGNLWLTVTLPTSIAMRKAADMEHEVRARLRRFPEVRMVLSQLGRPDDGTDAKGFNNLELLIDLQPRATWRHADKAALVADMNAALAELPGIELNFSQVIEDNVEEAISGVKGEVAVKIFGDDLKTLQEKADQVAAILRATRGATDVAAESQAGLAQVSIAIDRARIARHDVNVADVDALIETAIGGKAATQMLEGDERFDVSVRLTAAARDSVAALASLEVPTPDGRSVPLGQLATISVEEGASRISRENNMRRIAIKCNLNGRDQGSFVAEARARAAREVVLPPGYRLEWSGEFENQERAMKRLYVIVPVSLLLIFVLLFFAFNSVKNALLIVLNVPFALIGGLVVLFVTGIHLSISAAVGFIALFGIAVQNGVILVSQIKRLRSAGASLEGAVLDGAASRLRPVLMTGLMAMLGLIPAAVSSGVGSETAKPFAIVIISGLVSATVLTLTLVPALYRYFEEAEGG